MSIAKHVGSVEPSSLAWLEIEDTDGKVYRYVRRGPSSVTSPHVDWRLGAGGALVAVLVRDQAGVPLLRRDDRGLPSTISVNTISGLGAGHGIASYAGWEGINEYEQELAIYKPSTESRNEVPQPEDVNKLPRRACVAFAARCARRVQLLLDEWQEVTEKHRYAIWMAIAHAESTAFGRPFDTQAAGGAIADQARAVVAVAAGAGPKAAAASAAEAAATANAAAEEEAGASHAIGMSVVAHYATGASISAWNAATTLGAAAAQSASAAIWSNYDALLKAAQEQQWTNKTQVPPSFFGPMWPNGEPKDWPKPSIPQIRHARDSGERLAVQAYVSEFTPEDEAVSGLVRLYRALSNYHKARGGAGLVLDDWQVLVPADEPVEA